MRLQHFKNTIVCGTVGVGIVAFAFLFHMDVFDFLVTILEYLEAYEVDEILIAGVLLLLGLAVDLALIRRDREHTIEVQKQRLKVLRATVRTVQDIVNNFLNNLMLFRLEAEEKNALSQGALQQMDSLIVETGAKLKALADLDSAREKPMAGGLTGIDFGPEP